MKKPLLVLRRCIMETCRGRRVLCAGTHNVKQSCFQYVQELLRLSPSLI